MADKGRVSVDPKSSFARLDGGRNKSRSRNGRAGGQAAPAQRRPSFDTKAFLARVGEGQSIGKYRKGQVVFSQGDTAEAVFYIQEGRRSSPSFPARQRGRHRNFLELMNSSAKDVLPGKLSALQRSRP